MKVFLDVGAHLGESLNAVRDPKYRFDRIYCFEPASSCWPSLEEVRDRRVTVCRFGLWRETCLRPLYDAGSIGASMFADKFAGMRPDEPARFVRATDWLREHLPGDHELLLKLNCEGAEADIVDDLLESGELKRMRSVMIDPDVRKIPSQAHRAEELRERLRASRLDNWVMEDEVMLGETHRARIQHWLGTVGAEEPSGTTWVRQSWFVLAEAVHGRREPLRTAVTHH